MKTKINEIYLYRSVNYSYEMERSLSLHVNYWFILAKENFITVIFSTPLLRMIIYRYLESFTAGRWLHNVGKSCRRCNVQTLPLGYFKP